MIARVMPAGAAPAAARPGRPLKPVVDGCTQHRELTRDLLHGHGGPAAFNRASSGGYRNAAGVLTGAAADAARHHHDVNGIPLGVLLEPQSTNLALRSEAFDATTGFWFPANLQTIGADTLAAPDGSTTAEALTANATTGNRYVFSDLGAGAVATFDLSAGTATGTSTYGSGFTAVRQRIEDWGGGWYRCVFTVTLDTGTTFTQAYGLDGTTVSGTSQIGAWGAQMEVGSDATSYIPTAASTATRVADALTFAAEGVLPANDFSLLLTVTCLPDTQPFSVLWDSDATSPDMALIWDSTVNRFRFRKHDGSAFQYAEDPVSPRTLAAGQTYRFGIRVSSVRGMRMWIDGAPGANHPDTTDGPVGSGMYLGRVAAGYHFAGCYRDLLICPEPLPDRVMEAWTS